MSTKPTPGPYTLAAHVPIPSGRLKIESRSGTIATLSLRGAPAHDLEKHYANGTLLAAAPELLAALRALVEACCDLDFDAETDDAINEARRVIAMAEAGGA